MLTYFVLKCQIKITVKDQVVTLATPRIDTMGAQARIVGGMLIGKGKELADFFLISVRQAVCMSGAIPI